MNQPKTGALALLLALGALLGIGAAMWLGRKTPLGQSLSSDLTRTLHTARGKAGRQPEETEDPLFI